MTDFEICPTCLNMGTITVITYPPFRFHPWQRRYVSVEVMPHPGKEVILRPIVHYPQKKKPPLTQPSYATTKGYCNCIWGRRVAAIDEKMNRPDYVNPMELMTDAEILKAINDTIDNQHPPN